MHSATSATGATLWLLEYKDRSAIADICHFKNKTILILNPQCYECTSIGYDDEPGGNCSDSQPGGKVVKYFTILVVAVITVLFCFMV